jgi:hypothetical protein
LEKNPMKGGTPAIENNKIVNTKRLKLLNDILLKEYSVFSFVLTIESIVQNSVINAKL